MFVLQAYTPSNVEGPLSTEKLSKNNKNRKADEDLSGAFSDLNYSDDEDLVPLKEPARPSTHSKRSDMPSKAARKYMFLNHEQVVKNKKLRNLGSKRSKEDLESAQIDEVTGLKNKNRDILLNQSKIGLRKDLLRETGILLLKEEKLDLNKAEKLVKLQETTTMMINGKYSVGKVILRESVGLEKDIQGRRVLAAISAENLDIFQGIVAVVENKKRSWNVIYVIRKGTMRMYAQKKKGLQENANRYGAVGRRENGRYDNGRRNEVSTFRESDADRRNTRHSVGAPPRKESTGAISKQLGQDGRNSSQGTGNDKNLN
ncbi:hypothetical protein JTB14_021255 [Gonioctena quinquepunctata]|nr:hypothetical protein JTB14_021255 [Gonioctena quinquepunctata]